MESWLKALIATACVVVIACGGYFAWNEYKTSVERAEAERHAEQRAQKLLCAKLLRELSSGDFTEDWRRLHISFCIDEGHFNKTDLSPSRLRSYLRPAARPQQAQSRSTRPPTSFCEEQVSALELAAAGANDDQIEYFRGQVKKCIEDGNVSRNDIPTAVLSD